MIRITYSPDRQPLAERIRDDLSDRILRPTPFLIVLVSRHSNVDPHVQAEIEKAMAKSLPVLPILSEDVALPAALAEQLALDFSGGYDRDRLLRRLARLTGTQNDVRRANRRALVTIGGIAALMFGIALIAIAGGLVAFPVAEYNEEATFQAQWIGGLIGQTLERVQPRSTEDALHFPATHEAAPTRLYLYIRETATALPKAGGS
ncbi:MAG: TIR domain-containing protein [Chloroflexi bacterium]|nr:TIR domain-containing protein [Chloroflexota bacterium]